MADLLDVNVLVALAWTSHVHHQAAHVWLAGGDGAWATCPTTQAGFIRVSSNSNALRDARTPREALALLRRMTALPRHLFWPDATNLAASRSLEEERLTTYRQVTDAHLVTLAGDQGGRLVTFDRGVRRLVPEALADSRVVLLST